LGGGASRFPPRYQTKNVAGFYDVLMFYAETVPTHKMFKENEEWFKENEE